VKQALAVTLVQFNVPDDYAVVAECVTLVLRIPETRRSNIGHDTNVCGVSFPLLSAEYWNSTLKQATTTSTYFLTL
jgi:hypothetical protein